MSQIPSLGQAMQTLSLHPSSQPPQTANTADLERIALPRPPPLPIAKDRRLYYGFEVTEQWFKDFYEQNSHRIREYNPATATVWKMFSVRALLIKISGCRNISVVHATHKVAESMTECDPFCGYILITVCSTTSRSYHRRPNQGQMGRLRAIFEREPEWFVNHSDDDSAYDDA
ncbi:hypothetical protein D9615_004872 [Tricholomella constricta]|uniref:Uncharacterized protein n=1 Tax=Tricholomella constricta TaxID=117010 RepID=A0A8H5HH57_9AGAR|nr:hypothetical protein D9615_004872 [Tricholomella constricta]